MNIIQIKIAYLSGLRRSCCNYAFLELFCIQVALSRDEVTDTNMISNSKSQLQHNCKTYTSDTNKKNSKHDSLFIGVTGDRESIHVDDI